MQALNQGAESALLPLFNTASLVGFGAVIATLPGFDAFRQSLDGLAGDNVLISAALSSAALAGITGSASGGMSIALDVLGPSMVLQAAIQGVDPGLLHRVIAVATGGLDTLPHNGAVVTLLGICGMTHRQAYGDIFIVAVVVPTVACALIIALGMASGVFRTLPFQPCIQRADEAIRLDRKNGAFKRVNNVFCRIANEHTA